MTNKLGYERFKQWYLTNSSPEFREDVYLYYGIDFDWIYERIFKAGLECVLTPGPSKMHMRISTKHTLQSSPFGFVFSFATGEYPNYSEFYSEDIPGSYSYDPTTGRLVKVEAR